MPAEPKPFTIQFCAAETPIFALIGADGQAVECVRQYLAHLTACDRSPATVKSYVYALMDWFTHLHGQGVDWSAALPSHVRDYVLALRSRPNPYRQRGQGRLPAGSVNPQTGKASLKDRYQPTTINHHLSVIASLYRFLQDEGLFVGVNPAQPTRRNRYYRFRGSTPYPLQARAPFRQKVPQLQPRALSDEQVSAVFSHLTTHRDRAIIHGLLSAGLRASELLGMTPADVDWGGQKVRVISKGSRSPDWVAASPEFFTALRLYLAERPPLSSFDALWQTQRQPIRALTYTALRAVLGRVNARLGTNWVLHDWRHTCGLRLASDPAVPLVYVQGHLRHQSITTTQTYLRARPDEVIRHALEHFNRPPAPRPPSPSWGYADDDLAAFFSDDKDVP
jgi:integrase